MTDTPKFKRILLKLSGEALMGSDAYGINRQTIMEIVGEVKSVVDLGVQVGVVIGGGNIFRGVAPAATGMDRAQADYMGMLATVMNGLALQDAMRVAGMVARVQSALNIEQVVEPYIRGRAIRYLEQGRTVIFAGGTGNPFFTTDTAAALRGAEIGAEIVLKATKVDGIYSADPKKDPLATRYERISFNEAISKNLAVMDATAFALCRDQRLPINVFSIFKPGALRRVVLGQGEGTLGFLLRESGMSIADVKKTTEHKMQKSLEALKVDLAKVRTGRAHVGLLDHVQVEYYGAMVPVNTVANITLLDSRTLGVQAWEKAMAPKIERAIRDSDLGLNPASQGELTRVPMPALTEERRRDLIKVVKHECENARVAMRNLRRDAIATLKDLLKSKACSEDEERRAQDDVQKLTDKYVAEVDKQFAQKEAELMAV